MNKVKLSPYHLTFYYEQQLDPKRYDYNITFVQKIRGPLDAPRLSKAISRFVSENFVYQSRITEENKEYYWLKSDNPPELEIISYSIRK